VTAIIRFNNYVDRFIEKVENYKYPKLILFAILGLYVLAMVKGWIP
jgi:hypothetical protein